MGNGVTGDVIHGTLPFGNHFEHERTQGCWRAFVDTTCTSTTHISYTALVITLYIESKSKDIPHLKLPPLLLLCLYAYYVLTANVGFDLFAAFS